MSKSLKRLTAGYCAGVVCMALVPVIVNAASPLYGWQTERTRAMMDGGVVSVIPDGNPRVVEKAGHGNHAVDSPTDPNYYPVCRPDFTNPSIFPECNFTQTNPFFMPQCLFTDPMWVPMCDMPTNPAWWFDCQTNPQFDPFCGQPTDPFFDPFCVTQPQFDPVCVTVPQYDPLCPPTHPAWDPLCQPTSPTWDPLCQPTSPSWDPVCVTDPMYDTSCPTSGTEDGPASFGLAQNHPNPFNPVTVIGFNLPETGHARLRVHDINGRLVQVLADGMLGRGAHRITFDAAGLPAGLYVATLESAGRSESRKMVLLK